MALSQIIYNAWLASQNQWNNKTTPSPSTKNNLTSQQEQEAKKQAELAKKQEILARLLAQCSPPPRTELQACTRIISSLESLQDKLTKI